MTLREALVANHHHASRGSVGAMQRRGALLRHARERGVTVRDLAELLAVTPTRIFDWSGGALGQGRDAALDDQAPRDLRPPLDAPAPLPGQETLIP